ncbi:MAG: hypothetical protein GY715_01000 [Planctomycetes bacterium]|nr:hypothetical protein [Planctomycetota bacterium]
MDTAPRTEPNADASGPDAEMAFDCACHVYIDSRAGRMSYRLVLEPFDELEDLAS